MYDVVIVGAGPAGSSLALRLSRKGYDVALLDRARFPRSKACGDYLCAGGVLALAELGVAERVLAGAHALRKVALYGFGEHVCLALPGQGARSLGRDTLDTRMLQAALEAGARLIHGSFMHASNESRSLRVSLRDGEGREAQLDARVLVGADGAWSAVARRCGLAGPGRRRGRWAVGGELHGVAVGDALEMYVAERGYYARNPLGPRSVNSMLVLARPPVAAQADAIVERITGGKLRFEAEKMTKMLAIGPIWYRAASVMRGRILLSGDAAELLDPFTGQGVATAFALSAPAASAVAAALSGYPLERVARWYRTQWDEIVRPRRALAAMVRAMVRVGWIRRRCLRSMRRHLGLEQAVLAAASNLVSPGRALEPKLLWKLLAA